MIYDIVIYVGSAMLLLGSLFGLLAAIGVLRLPDLATRAHAASKAGVIGAGLALFTVALVAFDAVIALRALLGITFLLITTPLAAHLLVRAGYRTDEKMRIYLTLDERQPKSKSPL